MEWNKLMQMLKQFRDKRDWKRYHTPENLAKSIVIEAAELLEHFQWTQTPENMDGVSEELADVLIYCFLLLDHYGWDLDEIIAEKIEKNKVKYPLEKEDI